MRIPSLIAVITALNLCLISCAKTYCGNGEPIRMDRASDGSAPPVYPFTDTSELVLLSEGGLERLRGSGQIILVGDMGLTAAHTLPRFRGLSPTSEIVLPREQRARFEVVESGVKPGERIVGDVEVGRIESVPSDSEDGSSDRLVHDFLEQTQFIDDETARVMKHIRSFEAIADDWALVRLEQGVSTDGAGFEIETGPIPVGTCVSVFRSSADGRELLRLDMRVVGIDFEDLDAPPPPESIVGLWNARRVETDGWSGGFVGRRDETGRWKLIGVLTTGDEKNRLATATRPPGEVLERLIRGDGGAGAAP